MNGELIKTVADLVSELGRLPAESLVTGRLWVEWEGPAAGHAVIHMPGIERDRAGYEGGS
jgi:hypothetical protein